MHHEKPNVIADNLRHRQHNTELEGFTIQMWRARLSILSNTLFLMPWTLKKLIHNDTLSLQVKYGCQSKSLP